jgi:hypothetical protein
VLTRLESKAPLKQAIILATPDRSVRLGETRREATANAPGQAAGIFGARGKHLPKVIASFPMRTVPLRSRCRRCGRNLRNGRLVSVHKLSAFRLFVSMLLASIGTLASANTGFPRADYLTGNWGGLSDRWKDSGIDVNLHYTAEPMYTVSGGEERGGTYADNIGLDFIISTSTNSLDSPAPVCSSSFRNATATVSLPNMSRPRKAASRSRLRSRTVARPSRS